MHQHRIVAATFRLDKRGKAPMGKLLFPSERVDVGIVRAQQL